VEKSTAELTVDYIQNHPSIRNCLKNGLLNYSSLARLIAQELSIEKKTSKEAILVAARRFQLKLKKELPVEEKIKNLLANSEVELKNKIDVSILKKNISFDQLQEIQKRIVKENGLFYLLEGSDNYTLITQSKYQSLIKTELKNYLLKHHQNLALMNFKSPKEIEHQLGVIAFLTSLFAENGVNIIELISCWTDTIFIIKTEDIPKSLQFLKF
jgi:hypothetical protein